MKHFLIAAALVAVFSTQAMAYTSWGFNVSVGNPVPPPQVYVREYYPPPPPPAVVVVPPPPPPAYVYDYRYYPKHRRHPHYHRYW